MEVATEIHRVDGRGVSNGYERIGALHPDLLLPGHGAPARRPHIPTTES